MDDWKLWLREPPPYALNKVEAHRPEWVPPTRIIEPNNLNPHFNVADLWWRPAPNTEGERG